MEKAAKLIVKSERFLKECESKRFSEKISENKTITLIKKIENCKPFIGVNVLFVFISIILIGIIISLKLR